MAARKTKTKASGGRVKTAKRKHSVTTKAAPSTGPLMCCPDCRALTHGIELTPGTVSAVCSPCWSKRGH